MAEHQNHLGGLIKPEMAGSHPRVSDSVELGSSPRIHTSDKFPEGANAIGLGTSR